MEENKIKFLLEESGFDEEKPWNVSDTLKIENEVNFLSVDKIKAEYEVLETDSNITEEPQGDMLQFLHIPVKDENILDQSEFQEAEHCENSIQEYNEPNFSNIEAIHDEKSNSERNKDDCITRTELLSNPIQEQISCCVCNEVFIDKKLYRRHFATHKGQRSYICHICKKHFNSRSTLFNHSKIHSGIRPYTCNLCTKNFIYKQCLERHLRLHSGDRPYSCVVCQRTFIQKSNLKQHEVVHKVKESKLHDKERPFSCDTCNKSFNNKYCLAEHCKLHTGEKPFKCTVCNASFIQKYTLVNHMKTHNPQKNSVQCAVCNITFSNNISLMRHYRKHTELRPFSCTECDKYFVRIKDLEQHSVTHKLLMNY